MMLNRMTKLLSVWMIVILCLFAAGASAATATQDGLTVTLATDRQSYDEGDTVNVTL